jgi:kinesin family protein 5
VEKAQTSGITFEQGKYINKSLSVLGNVINNLVKNSLHIPYRESKLTRILADSLGGNSKTCLILTISSDITNIDETISTLRFGTSAKKIKNKPKKNIELSIEEYKKLLLLSEERIKDLEKKLLHDQILS